MDQDWLAHVRTYAANADEAVVKKIVNYCGIALRNRDSSLVSFSDPTETARVRENYLRKKLALTDDDAALDSGIASIGQRMAGDTSKNRVTAYYLLADHFDRLDVFGGTRRGIAVGGEAGGVAAAPAGAATLAAMPVPEPVADPVAPPVVAAAPEVKAPTPTAPMAAANRGDRRAGGQDDGIVETGCLAAAVVVGAIVVAGLLALWISRDEEAPTAPAVPVAAEAPAAPVTAEPVTAETAPAAPADAGTDAASPQATPVEDEPPPPPQG